jgi:twitching motility protein PilT
MHLAMADLASILQRSMERGASDLHLKAGNRALVRIDGELLPLDPEGPVLDGGDTTRMLHEVASSHKVKELETTHEADFSYVVPGFGSFRGNAYVQRGTVAIVLRVIPAEIRTVAELNLPEVLCDLAEEHRGFVIVTGSTGSGKTTALAAIVHHINTNLRRHIVTIEDPIEFVHRDILSSIAQREVGDDTESFNVALRRALRQDPDVILVGEMRDQETVRTALSAAETGHLVLSTLHTNDAPEAINRIVDFFPDREQQHARAMLASTLRGIVSLRLIPAVDGVGRIPIAEVMTTTGRVRDMIMNPAQTHRLAEVIETGEYYGMQTFDQALYRAVAAGQADLEDAIRYATQAHDLRLLVAGEGRRRTSMEDITKARIAAGVRGGMTS